MKLRETTVNFRPTSSAADRDTHGRSRRPKWRARNGSVGVEVRDGDDPGTFADEVLTGTPDADLIQAEPPGRTSVPNIFVPGFGDTLSGGAGDDTLVGGPGGDHLDGGDGVDTVVLTNFELWGVMVLLGEDVDGHPWGGAPGEQGVTDEDRPNEVDTLISIENVVGTRFSDDIVGGAGANRLDGGEGNDTLGGVGGDDTVLGGGGNDVVRGGEGNDQLSGGAGRDLLTDTGGSNYLRGDDGDDPITGGAGFDDINGNMGNDTVHGGRRRRLGGGRQGQRPAVRRRRRRHRLGQPGQRHPATAATATDQVRGGQGDDSLTGGAGNDFVSGDRGNDTMTGGAGRGHLPRARRTPASTGCWTSTWPRATGCSSIPARPTRSARWAPTR